ncbi:hypothetical protein E5D57_010023 [Metarhizium anisopliae]|nr:hypothetical protein E5D57_010023 [Metarhizium anisopliae]
MHTRDRMNETSTSIADSQRQGVMEDEETSKAGSNACLDSRQAQHVTPGTNTDMYSRDKDDPGV